MVESTAQGTSSVPVRFPTCRFDGTRFLPSYIFYVNKARAVRQEDSRGFTQHAIFSEQDSQFRLEAEILEMLR